jgi:hypothetical protein
MSRRKKESVDLSGAQRTSAHEAAPSEAMQHTTRTDGIIKRERTTSLEEAIN